MRVLSLAEAKAKLSQLVSEVESADEEITITRHGKAVAVLVSREEFESWKETAEIMSDADFLGAIQKGRKELKEGRADRFDAAALDRLFGSGR